MGSLVGSAVGSGVGVGVSVDDWLGAALGKESVDSLSDSEVIDRLHPTRIRKHSKIVDT